MNPIHPTTPPIIVDLHGMRLAFQSTDLALQERFKVVYGHLPRVAGGESDIFIGWHIHKLPTAPPTAAGDAGDLRGQADWLLRAGPFGGDSNAQIRPGHG